MVYPVFIIYILIRTNQNHRYCTPFEQIVRGNYKGFGHTPYTRTVAWPQDYAVGGVLKQKFAAPDYANFNTTKGTHNEACIQISHLISFNQT